MGTTSFKIREVVYKSLSVKEKTDFKCKFKQIERVNKIIDKKYCIYLNKRNYKKYLKISRYFAVLRRIEN